MYQAKHCNRRKSKLLIQVVERKAIRRSRVELVLSNRVGVVLRMCVSHILEVCCVTDTTRLRCGFAQRCNA